MENVKQDTNIGTNILRVSASDEDADNNGAIRYSLTAPGDPSDLDYFDIQPESGWIFLTKPLDVSLIFPWFLIPPMTKVNYYIILLLHFLWYTLLLFLKNSDHRNSCRIYFWSKNFWTTMKILKKNAKNFCDAIFIFFWCFIFYNILLYYLGTNKISWWFPP